MNKKQISKLFIFLITISLGMVKAYGETEVGQTVQTDVQPAVAVSKESSEEVATITDIKKGTHSGMQTVFGLETNEDKYNFIMSSKVVANGTEHSAYGNNGDSIIFVHTLNPPTESAIINAKNGQLNSPNVIAYPIDVNVIPTDCEMEKSFENDAKYGDCYVIRVNGIGTGKLTHRILENPVNNTYSVAEDQAGSYQAVVTVTAVEK